MLYLEVSITNQAFIFLSSVAAGLIVGFVFDIFRILRKVIKTSNVITYIEDILFWILVAIIIFILVFVTNNGELRWYEFLGVALGVIFYHLLFSMYIIKISVKIINIIKKIVISILRVLLFPFLFLYKQLRKPCRHIIHWTKKGSKRVRKIFSKCKRKIIVYFKNIKVVLKKT